MTELNITPTPAQETQSEIDAMVAKAEGKEAPQETTKGETEQTPERPAWLPEKFKTPEDMAKAYAEMEKKQSAPKEASAETPEGEAQAEAQEAAQAAVEGAGLDMEALGQKIVANGDIDEADYEALAKQGITKDMVKNYVAGQQAIAEKMVTNMHASVGGEEAFNELLAWGAENLSPDEVEAFNNTIDNGSEAAVKLALQGLQARATEANGKTPKLLGGNRSNNTGGDVFRSTAEVTKAMSDPRYTKDPAYRADVMAKLGRSNVM